MLEAEQCGRELRELETARTGAYGFIKRVWRTTAASFIRWAEERKRDELGYDTAGDSLRPRGVVDEDYSSRKRGLR
jgi:hypothetical protein